MSDKYTTRVIDIKTGPHLQDAPTMAAARIFTDERVSALERRVAVLEMTG